MASVTTRDKLSFVWAMARNTRATVRQCEALMRYAATLQRLAEDDCNVPADDAGLARREAKRDRIRRKVAEICLEIRGSEADALRYALRNIEVNLTGKDYAIERWKSSLKYASQALKGEHSDAALGEYPEPIFSSDPRGAVLKIRVPDGWSDDFGGEGICVPS